MSAPVIESVEMRRFRGIRACKEPIRLSRFTVLIGRNNAGKTSVLEALSLLPVRSIDEVRFSPVRWTMKQFMDFLHGGIYSLVYGYVGKAIINYVVRGKEITWEYEAGGTQGKLSLPREELAELLSIESEKGWEALSSILLLPNDTRFLIELANSLGRKTEWRKVEESGANTSIVRLIDKVVNDHFTEASVHFDSIVLRKVIDKEGPYERIRHIEVSDLGDGVERVLLFGLWLETYRPKVVLWDDIEASAHPGLVEAVLEWLASRDWQVVLTTHSLDVLDRLVAIEPEGASVVVLKKRPDDVLEPRTLSLEELREKLESHVDVRREVDIL